MASKGHSGSTETARAFSLVFMNEQSLPKKLTRSRNDRFVGGVAAGLGNYFNVDAVFVRIAFVASLALGGLGLLAYLVLLAVMPVEGDPSEPLPPIEPKRRNLMIGFAVAIGIVALATADSGSFAAWIFGFWPGTVFGILFWSAAALVVIWLLATGRFSRGDGDSADTTTPSAATAESAPPAAQPAAPAASSEEPAESVTYAESPTQLSRTELMETRKMSVSGWPIGTSPDPAPAEDAPSVIGKIMLWVAIGLAALTVFCTLFVISAGVTVLLGGLPMAAVVIILGGAMVYAGLQGRRQLSLWLLTAAIAITLPMAAVSIADLRVKGSYGDINETPVAVTDIPGDGYKMAAGKMTIDLRKFDFLKETRQQNSRNLNLDVESGMGLTSVIVPDWVCVTGDVTGKAGVINIRGHQSNGIDVSQDAATVNPSAPKARGPVVVDLNGQFKLGAFEVVDNTQWRQSGRAGSFEDNDLEPDDVASARARERSDAACAGPPAVAVTKVKETARP